MNDRKIVIQCTDDPKPIDLRIIAAVIAEQIRRKGVKEVDGRAKVH